MLELLVYICVFLFLVSKEASICFSELLQINIVAINF